MLTLKIQDKNISKRSKDDNGFLIIKNNPITKAGVFEYLLSEIESDISENDDKIVKVFRPFEDLIKIKDSFANKPVKFNHIWVGEDDNKADGAIGSNITIDKENLMLRADLIIYNPELINAIENDNLVELSPGYTGAVEKANGIFNGEPYEYIQKITCVNHLAVVDKGRSGPDLKIEDSKRKILKEYEKMKTKLKDRLLNKIKRILDEDTIEKEVKDADCQDEDIKTQDEDKREIIREIMAVANKKPEDFEGGEDERERTIAELAEKLAYNPSETSKTDDEDIDEKETQDTDEVEEVKEEKKEEIDTDDLAETIAEVVTEVVEKKVADFEDRMFKKSKRISDTYARVKNALGYPFDYSAKNENDLYKFGYENLTGKELPSHLDAKTAFELAYGNKPCKMSFADSKSSVNDAEKAIFDMLNKQ
ncbi:DUF2213 domain-containing protein [Campylobacter jejuni]|nr:DUF2213 domain-containing protein [Campylobacter jejuni]